MGDWRDDELIPQNTHQQNQNHQENEYNQPQDTDNWKKDIDKHEVITILALILSIMSLVCCCGSPLVAVIALTLAIISIVHEDGKKTRQIIAIIIAVISIAINSLWYMVNTVQNIQKFENGLDDIKRQANEEQLGKRDTEENRGSEEKNKDNKHKRNDTNKDKDTEQGLLEGDTGSCWNSDLYHDEEESQQYKEKNNKEDRKDKEKENKSDILPFEESENSQDNQSDENTDIEQRLRQKLEGVTADSRIFSDDNMEIYNKGIFNNNHDSGPAWNSWELALYINTNVEAGTTLNGQIEVLSLNGHDVNNTEDPFFTGGDILNICTNTDLEVNLTLNRSIMNTDQQINSISDIKELELSIQSERTDDHTGEIIKTNTAQVIYLQFE